MPLNLLPLLLACLPLPASFRGTLGKQQSFPPADAAAKHTQILPLLSEAKQPEPTPQCSRHARTSWQKKPLSDLTKVTGLE